MCWLGNGVWVIEWVTMLLLKISGGCSNFLVMLEKITSWACLLEPGLKFIFHWKTKLFILFKSLLNPDSPMMEFFYKILLSEEVFSKMNIFGFIFEKKNQIRSKNLKISFPQFKLTLAEGGYRLFFKKKQSV